MFLIKPSRLLTFLEKGTFFHISCGLHVAPITAYYFIHILPNVLNQQSATQTILSLPSRLDVVALFHLIFPSPSVDRERARDSCSPLTFITRLTVAFAVCSASAEPWCAAGLRVDLGALTSTRWACGLAAASSLLFCLYNGITSTKQKKGRSQQFPGQAALFSHLGESWGFGSRAAKRSLPARAHTDTWSLRNTQPWNFLPVSQEWSAGSAFDGICLALLCKLLFWETL